MRYDDADTFAAILAYLAAGGRIAVYAPGARAVHSYTDTGAIAACAYPRPLPVLYHDTH